MFCPSQIPAPWAKVMVYWPGVPRGEGNAWNWLTHYLDALLDLYPKVSFSVQNELRVGSLPLNQSRTLYTDPDEFATYWNSFPLMIVIPVKRIKFMKLVLLNYHIMPSLFAMQYSLLNLREHSGQRGLLLTIKVIKGLVHLKISEGIRPSTNSFWKWGSYCNSQWTFQPFWL